MFRKVDCIRIQVPNVEEALRFYHEKLGWDIVWRRGLSEAGLRMGESDSELVLVREKLEESEVDILVKSVDDVAKEFQRLGGKIIIPPFDIAVGRCCRVEDPWGNRFVILDMAKGPLKTNLDGSVIEQ